MRILGLDPGTSRIGVAMSDALGIVAHPLAPVRAHPRAEVWEELRFITEETPVERIVVGLPRNMDGSEGAAAADARKFARELERELGIAVRTWDERLSTAQARRVLIRGNVSRRKRRRLIDGMAATLILQSYLDCTGT